MTFTEFESIVYSEKKDIFSVLMNFEKRGNIL